MEIQSIPAIGARPLSVIHISTHPFPVTKAFYGQTFVILALMHLSDYSDVARKSVWCSHRPVSEQRFVEYAEQVSKDIVKRQVNGTLEYDATTANNQPSQAFFKFLKSEIDQGLFPVIYHHYPIGVGSTFIKAVDNWGRDGHIRDKFLIVPYFHTLMNYHSRTVLNSSRKNLKGRYDFAIMVSDAARFEFGTLLNDLDNSYTVLNGINMKLYRQGSLFATALRKHVGLNSHVKKIVCFVGRLSPDKGAHLLLETISHFNRNCRSHNDIGFIIASSLILDPNCVPRIFEGFLNMRRLIEEDRLKFVIDISKYTFADESVHEDYALLLQLISGYDVRALRYVYEKKYGIKGCSRSISENMFLNWPVQTLAHIVLQPSVKEAFGLSIVESIASSAYLLTNNVGGIPEIFSSQSFGKLFDPTSPNLVQQYVDTITAVEVKEGYLHKNYYQIRERFDEGGMAYKVHQLTRKYAHRLSMGRRKASSAVPKAQKTHK